MIQEALEIALPDEEEFRSGYATSRMLASFAPAPEGSGAASMDAWPLVDRAATLAAFSVFNQREDSIELTEDGLGFTSVASQLPDEALIGRMDPRRGRRAEPINFEGKRSRLSAVLALVDAHQSFYGPVDEAWARLLELRRVTTTDRQFARRVVTGIRRYDAYGEDADFSGDKTLGDGKASIGRGVRTLAAFYDMCTAQDDDADEGERLVQDLLRLRFSRTLTAIEGLWDLLLTYGRPSGAMLWSALFSLGPDKISEDYFEGGARWVSTPRGFRVAPHALDFPDLNRFLRTGELQRYDRRARFTIV
jgi:hypothetical protein